MTDNHHIVVIVAAGGLSRDVLYLVLQLRPEALKN